MIEIPGYRVVRQIGRGGMATVYLAIQRSVDREVALKVMSPQLLADPNYGERFLREARIAAKLHHRHVVGVHDVGRYRDLHFIAMEYLPGGSILPRGEGSRSAAFALRVTREIATALSYAHAKGFVHRDVKPDNILLREDDSAALADFGIARASESATRMTRTGAVVGTPHYMSPEQARGRPIDGRADLYSLGIVLYEMLAGRVPYEADDSLAVGIMHISEPVPLLPPPYEALQPLLSRLLAKQPEERYQDGSELALAIHGYEQALAAGELAGVPMPAEDERRRMLETRPLPRAAPPQAATTQLAPLAEPEAAYGRGEPRIGRIDDALLRDDRPRAAPARTRRERGVLRTIFTILALTVIVVALWSSQDRLRALLPETEVNTLLVEGDAALDRGQLTGPESASARYAQVLVLDPDNTRAIEGRIRIGERLLADARTALESGRIDDARSLALAARALLGGGDALAALDQQVEAAAARTGTLDTLLAQARDAQAAGRLAGSADAALELYRQALVADPDNAIAAAGLQAVLDALAAQAQSSLRNDELARGTAAIEQIARASPGHPGLPELRAALGDAERRAAQRAIDERHRGEGLLVQASAALDANDPAAAAGLIDEAQRTGVAATDIAVARTRLAELEERNAIAASAESSAAQQQRADALVAEAEAALASGKLMDPPGANAYDKYREALGADPRHARANAGIAALPAHARTLFAGAIEENRLGQAREYLDAVEAVRRDDPDLPRMRRELAIALLAQAERQIGDGQLDVAARSIEKARELAPGEPRITDAENRLRLARGS
ncbi:MAG TPA: protein kinase [Candidatus Saccharimonadia bacterium]|nr:protein kinase [Candidatus Saccharimonadia bacterium]